MLLAKPFLVVAFIGLTSGCKYREVIYKSGTDPIFKVIYFYSNLS